MIEIKPDPKHPRGGFAEITIPGGSVVAPDATGPVHVSVYNSYQQKWLGPAGWQPNKAALPARSASVDGGGLTLVVGPDIVNHIEEDTPIRIEIGEGGWDTYWPDDINKGPDKALVGDIGAAGAAVPLEQPQVMAAPAPAPVAEGEPAAPAAPVVDHPIPEAPEGDAPDQTVEAPFPETEEKRGAGKLLILLGILLALILAGLAYYFVVMKPGQAADPAVRQEPVQDQATAPELVPAPAPASDDPCSMGVLDTLQGGFSTMADRLRECGGAVSADQALSFLERAAAAGDADALALFGAIYDGTVTDEAMENTIGLTFPDQPARAAEYYARAAAAGSQEAATRLTATCRRLLLSTDTLSRSAHEDYCK